MDSQQDLFEHVLTTYAKAESVSNDDLYRAVGERAGLGEGVWAEQVPIGKAADRHNPTKRKLRWYQQTLRELGLLERDAARGRGFWKLTAQGKKKLTPAEPRRVLLGFSTDLGLALWGTAHDVFSSISEPIHLCVTSPPYPLSSPRAYGNVSVVEYVDWLCGQLEPIVKNLVPGGAICLNVSNDIFEPGLPSRSTYRERLVIALCDRLGLDKIDELIWHNPTKPPGPLRWSSITRQQLNVAWEPVYVFTNDAKLFRGDNRRVLQQHSDQHMRLMREGGEKRSVVNGDGAYRLYDGSYGNLTAGRIPRNVLTIPHRCADKEQLRRDCLAQGLPVHGASMPLKLPEFLVEYLSEKGDLVVDLFAGWHRTAKAAQNKGRRWMTSEQMGEYVLGSANSFRKEAGFEVFGALS